MRVSLSSNIFRISIIGLVFLFIPILSDGQLVQAKTTQHFKDSLKTKHLWLISQVVPGFGQIYNKQYKKAAIFYAGMGSMLYMGVRSNNTYKRYLSDYNHVDPTFFNRDYYQKKYLREKQIRNLYFAGAGAFYVASVVDALLVYNKNDHSAATATILSTVLPGAGQVYNRKFWKVPVIYGGISTLCFLVDWNNRGYIRFKRAVRKWPNDEFNGQRTEDELKLFRDIYRKNRDISLAGLLGVYVLNIIDANVDGNLYDWNVNDDLSFRVEPTIINNNFASTVYAQPAFGLNCTFNF